MDTKETLNQVDYPTFVNALVKPGALIKEELTAKDCNALHMAVGISGEAGELLDAIKKNTIYRKPADITNIIEELGDLEFYMEGLRQEYGISREATIAANIQKLSVRYQKLQFSNEAAIERADKLPEQA